MFSDALPPNTRSALALLGKSDVLADAYLAGGTALALYLGHRVSVDFDFFSLKQFDFDTVRNKLESLGQYKIEKEELNTMLGNFDGVSFSLFWYKFPLIGSLEEWNGIKVASKEDIAAMKLAALSGRATKKDYVDLYFLSKEVFSFEKMFGYLEQKYAGKINPTYYIMQALQYFEDVEKSEEPIMIKPVSWEEVKVYLRSETVRLAKIMGIKG